VGELIQYSVQVILFAQSKEHTSCSQGTAGEGRQRGRVYSQTLAPVCRYTFARASRSTCGAHSGGKCHSRTQTAEV
jgi:hypothetical protein